MAYQQNFMDRRIAIVVLGNPNWKVAKFHIAAIASAVDAATAKSYVEVEIPFK